ncbi:MAG: MBOAT family O-acyltransferase [Terracidiphilus sp.]|jgi:D-alanyl-lipoteichoic acid acyltransferase DltB (MBOAT superfamily)
MSVSSPPFFVFLIAVCLLLWLTARWRKLQIVVLAVANLFFLARFSPLYLALPLAGSIDFVVGLGLARFQSTAARKLLLGASLAVNLGLLVSLKLLPLVTGSLWQWLLPLSLSFYCFQSLTYTVDLYLGEGEPTQSLIGYLAAALFFPSITAGPIPRMHRVLGQLGQPFQLTNEDGGRALLLIGTGLVKKLLIADFLANNLVARVFDTPALYSSAEILIAVYAYALQLFFDFSGYTDIARGAALLMGIELPENFKQPYLSVNVAEFWRRWHITFSEWLRDYLFDFFPKRRKHQILSYSYAFLLTMMLGGLWHGISWNFLIWGALHGVALGFVFAWKRRRIVPSPAWWTKLLGGILTFNFVCFTWIFFRSGTLEGARAILRGLAGLTWGTENITPIFAAVLLAAALIHCLPPKWFEGSVGLAARVPFWAQGLAMAALILLIQTLAGRGSASFVYGNF